MTYCVGFGLASLGCRAFCTKFPQASKTIQPAWLRLDCNYVHFSSWWWWWWWWWQLYLKVKNEKLRQLLSFTLLSTSQVKYPFQFAVQDAPYRLARSVPCPVCSETKKKAHNRLHQALLQDSQPLCQTSGPVVSASSSTALNDGAPFLSSRSSSPLASSVTRPFQFSSTLPPSSSSVFANTTASWLLLPVLILFRDLQDG